MVIPIRAALVRFQDEARSRGYTRYCEEPGCLKITKEGKSHCIDHISRSSYVAALIEEVETMEKEKEKVETAIKEGKKIKIKVKKDGLLEKELLSHLSIHGPKTLRRLVRDLNVPTQMVEAYINSLKRRQMVKTTYSKRKAIVVYIDPEIAKELMAG